MKRLLFLLPLCLIACDGGSVKDTLGLSRKAPDEFRVVSRPPLSVPPEFNLRPPAAPGEEVDSAQEMPAHKEAESLVLGEGGGALKPGSAETAVQPVTSNAVASTGDAQFLQKAGAQKSEGSIRATLQKETGTQSEEEKSMLQKLREPGHNEPVVNAQGEAERLKENKQAGKPATEGDTPMAKPKDTGTLGRIFGY